MHYSTLVSCQWCIVQFFSEIPEIYSKALKIWCFRVLKTYWHTVYKHVVFCVRLLLYFRRHKTKNSYYGWQIARILDIWFFCLALLILMADACVLYNVCWNMIGDICLNMWYTCSVTWVCNSGTEGMCRYWSKTV